jgi:hypothetical protein
MAKKGWETPKELLEPLYSVLGVCDLDPVLSDQYFVSSILLPACVWLLRRRLSQKP